MSAGYSVHIWPMTVHWKFGWTAKTWYHSGQYLHCFPSGWYGPESYYMTTACWQQTDAGRQQMRPVFLLHLLSRSHFPDGQNDCPHCVHTGSSFARRWIHPLQPPAGSMTEHLQPMNKCYLPDSADTAGSKPGTIRHPSIPQPNSCLYRQEVLRSAMQKDFPCWR